MEQIQRANRMYTNDSIFLKKSLSIPVLADVVSENGEADNEAGAVPRNRPAGSSTQKRQDESGERASDMTPVDFLKRLDGLISQSKQAAVRGCQEAEERYVCMARCTLLRHGHAASLCAVTHSGRHCSCHILAEYITAIHHGQIRAKQ